MAAANVGGEDVHATSVFESAACPGTSCTLHTWKPLGPPRGVVVIYHGYASHSAYPTTRHAAVMLQSKGFMCMALDLPGHGTSQGTRGLIRSAAHLTGDGVAVARHAKEAHPGLPFFLFGNSMGGAIALNVARAAPELRPTGLVLLAPMLSIPEASMPPAWQVPLLQGIACIMPGAALLGGNATNPAVQYADPVRRAECEADTLAYSGNLRLASANAILTTATVPHTLANKPWQTLLPPHPSAAAILPTPPISSYLFLLTPSCIVFPVPGLHYPRG